MKPLVRWAAALLAVGVGVALFMASRQTPLPGPGDEMPEPEIELVFAGSSGGPDSSLFAARSDARVVELGDVSGDAPDVSPDATKVVFVRNDRGPNGRGISLLDFATNEVRQLTRPDDPETAHLWRDRSPVWSPDGAYIAFIRFDTEDALTLGEGVWIIDVEGDGEQVVEDLRVVDIVWEGASSASLLALVDHDGKAPAIHRVALDGEVENVSHEYPCLTLPEWTPDGERYACVGDTGLSLLLWHDGDDLTLPVRGSRQVAWSPKGDRVAFIARGRLTMVTPQGDVVGEAPHPDVVSFKWGEECGCIAYLAGDRIYHWDIDHHPAPVSDLPAIQGAFDWVH